MGERMDIRVVHLKLRGRSPSRSCYAALGASLVILGAAFLSIAAPPGVDSDRDGVPDAQDNCPFLANPDQADANSNGIGDLCEALLPELWDLSARTQPGQITIFSESGFIGGIGMPLASGDLNADGRDDVVFAPFATHGVKGWFSNGLFGQEIRFNPDGSAPAGGFVIRGTGTDQLGCEVEAADVDGDGIDDLLMGAPATSPGGVSNAGAVHVLFGGQPIPPALDLTAPPAELRLARIEGNVTAGGLGCWIASADVNGDATDDVLIAAQDADGPDGRRTDSGTFYLLLGGPGVFFPGAVVSVASAHLTVFGEDAGDNFGAQSAVGDFDGDGAMDLLIAASELFGGAGDGPRNRRRDAGEAVVLFGPFDVPGMVLDLRSLPFSSRLTVYGARRGDFLGEDVAAGDTDGDGTDDLIIGAFAANRFDGATYVVRGGPQQRGAVVDLLSPPAGVVRFIFPGALGFLGDTNQVTNLNRDRFDDLLLGAPEAFENDINVFITYGNTRFFDPPLDRDLSLPSPFPLTRVRKEFLETSYSATRGDVDGDGTLDAVFNALDAGGIAYVLGGTQVTGLDLGGRPGRP